METAFFYLQILHIEARKGVRAKRSCMISHQFRTKQAVEKTAAQSDGEIEYQSMCMHEK